MAVDHEHAMSQVGGEWHGPVAKAVCGNEAWGAGLLWASHFSAPDIAVTIAGQKAS
jgi:hypothetical protein